MRLLVVIDLAVKRLPDAIVGPLYLALFAALTAAAILDGNLAGLGRAAAAAVLAVAGYFLLAFISPAGLGLGDVKLAGVLAGFLGWLGWSEVLFGMLSAFALDAMVSLVLLASGPRQEGQRDPVRAPHGGRRSSRRRLRPPSLGVVSGYAPRELPSYVRPAR